MLTMAKYVAPLIKALGGGPKGAEGFEDAKWLRENFSTLVDEHVTNKWLRWGCWWCKLNRCFF